MILIQSNEIPVEVYWLKHWVTPNFLTRVPNKTAKIFHTSVLGKVKNVQSINFSYIYLPGTLVLFCLLLFGLL